MSRQSNNELSFQVWVLKYHDMLFLKIEFDNRLSGSRPDLLEPISFGSEVRLLALEQELQELREQISTIVKSNKMSKRMYNKSKM